MGIALQRLSDLVCLEHGLSVIKPRKPGERERYTNYQKKESFRAKLCGDIDAVLEQNPKSMEQFLMMLQEQEYEIKRGKYLVVKGKEQKRFIRFQTSYR